MGGWGGGGGGHGCEFAPGHLMCQECSWVRVSTVSLCHWPGLWWGPREEEEEEEEEEEAQRKLPDQRLSFHWGSEAQTSTQGRRERGRGRGREREKCKREKV